MSVVITASGNFGPFKTIEVLGDRLRCGDTDLPFSVIGSYTISEDDSLAPQPPAPALPVPHEVPMWKARDILIEDDLLDDVYAFFETIGDPIEKRKAISKFDTSNFVQRNDPLVKYVIPLMGKSEAEIDEMFRRADAL